MDPEIKANFQTLIEAQIRSEKTISDGFANLAAAQTRTEKAIENLAALVARQAEAADARMTAADARMTRVEANLDELVRIIKAEHSNGKARPQ